MQGQVRLLAEDGRSLGILGPAVLDRLPAQCGYRATGDGWLLRIEGAVVRAAAKRAPELRARLERVAGQERVEGFCLREAELARHVSLPELRGLLEGLRALTCGPGQVLEAPAGGLLLLREGEVELVRQDLVLARVLPGDTFGEGVAPSVLEGEFRPTGPGTVWVLDPARVRELAGDSPRFAGYLAARAELWGRVRAPIETDPRLYQRSFVGTPREAPTNDHRGLPPWFVRAPEPDSARVLRG